MNGKPSPILIGSAAVLGLFFGNAMGSVIGDFSGITIAKGSFDWQSAIMALVVGGLAAFAAYRAGLKVDPTPAPAPAPHQVQDPAVARFLLADPRAAALWLPLRLFIGWDFLEAGLHKFAPAFFGQTGASWMDSSASILGYWKGAVAINAQTGRGAISYEWWRGFLQVLIDNHADVWFSKVIVFGEIAVGLGLIAGALVGIAAMGGILMNLSFLLSGSTSSNPILLALGIGIILAWKVAGLAGLDRYLLPLLGTPWQPGAVLPRKPLIVSAPS
ncbi:MAG: DoxX family protein [Chloroflexota bacterium]|nr:DoxX family protein [Chloroflexota bacterium]